MAGEDLVELHGRHQVAFNLDLATHERLHTCCLVLLHEDLSSSLVVRGDGGVGVLEGTEFHVDIARCGVHVGPHSALAEGHVGDDLVDSQRHLDTGGKVCVLGTNRTCRVHPFF
ncbi:MAG: hypothetical protein RLZ84_1667 [Actinomycetota bacterium]